MKKLTRREKLLIYILGCFLIATAGIYLLLLPGYARYSEVKDQYDEAKYTQTTMAAAIETIPDLEMTKGEGLLTIVQKQEAFSDRLTNEGLDKVLTPLCLSYQLSPRRLSILSNGYAKIQVFKPGVSSDEEISDEEMVGLIDELDSLKDIDSTQEEVDQVDSPSEETAPVEGDASEAGISILTGVVELELKGTQANFYRLLDAVASRPDLVIESFEITPVSTKNSETINSGTTTTDISYSNWVETLEGGESEIKVTFNLYMVEKQAF